ncbi:two-component sensor histidine kinase [Sagittula marina]|uniref:histidine kinase n=1 Tax=Sagittula marina TaxID=943940 RepID=A0A7W6GRZ3_9RHOB|nr:ATP-binding protein [Sagittula marina]MBB3985232.1 two-component sensor histidine kinase [Sagittula marina]
MAQTITSLSLTVADDIKILQKIAKAVTASLGFKPFHATRLTTCAMELARNVIEHGQGGHARLSLHEPRGGAVVLRLAFADQGSGIDDLDAAMAGREPYAHGEGMGLGLAGARRMADNFQIETGNTGTLIKADFAAPIDSADIAQCAEAAGNRCDEILMREGNADRRIRQLESDLTARDLTIGEVHHRTANNLTMIGSLVRMEQRRAQTDEAKGVLSSLGIRIESMARTHKLLQSGDTESVRPLAYLQQISALAESFNRSDLIVHVDVNADDAPIPARLALDLGLITGELITNAFKHAFADRSEGRIAISMSTEGETITYRFSDDGIGLAPGQQPERSGSLGWRMIRATVSSNLGHLNVSGETGLMVEMTFPVIG